MARIRSVHPSLWTDESFVSVSPLARLFLIGLWNEADDNGIFQWKPITLKMRLLPGDGADATSLLEELEGTGAIMRYEVDGKSFGAVRNFRKFQRPERPKPVHPITPEIAQFVALDAKSHTCSKKNPGSVGDKAPRKQGQGSERKVNEQCQFDAQTPNEQCSSIETQGPMEWCKGKVISSLRSDIPPNPYRDERPDRSSEFDEFWSAYPRHVGKDAARKAHTKARTKATQAEIMLGLSRQVAVWPDRKSDRAQFIPYPASWLNSGGWQDDPNASAAAAPAPSQPQRNHGRPAIWDAVPDYPGV